MSCNETKFQEFLAPDFTESYVKQHTEVLNLNSIMVRNPNWTVYPPNNEMPFNAFYYTIPKFIKNFKNLQTLCLEGIFVIELPNELISLPNLRHIAFSLGTKSNIDGICHVLKEMQQLETLNLTGSVISDNTFDQVKRAFPNVQVFDTIRSMQSGTNIK